MVTKLFTRVDVRDVYLDGGNGYSLDGIVDGNGGVERFERFEQFEGLLPLVASE